MKFKKENISIYVFLSSLLAASGVGNFKRAFPEWNPALYLLSLLLMSICCGMLTFLYRKLKEKVHPTRDALIGIAVFFGLAFGAVFLVNNVILREENARLATCIMTFAFSAAFIAGAVFTEIAGTEKTSSRILVPVVCALLFVPYALSSLSPLLSARITHPFENKIQETEGLSMASEKQRLIINADDSHWWGFFNDLAKKGTFDDDAMNAYVAQYADSGVTDLFFNIFCQSSDTPSQVMTFRGDLYGQTEQDGKPVDYSPYYGLNEIYNVQKKDIFALWFDACRAAQIRPWISLRMNDCHAPDEETSLLRGDLFYTARDKGWMIGEEYGYFRNCLNYAVPEVRRLMLDYIREQLLRYDVFGLELDFMREIYCFDYINTDNAENIETMNGFLRDVAAIISETGQERGHEIQLSVRMMRDLDQCRVYGFDPETWCREGLVDSITVTPRFSSNDSAMPIADWKARCGETEIYAGIETLVNTQANGCCASAEVVRGYGAQYLTAGADGLYLFNYMSAGTVGGREREVYDTCGSLQSILTLPRRHVVTYQDTAPNGWAAYDPLPLQIKKNGTAVLDVETGYIPDGATATVCLGFANAPAADAVPTLTVNGRTCTADGETQVFGRSEADGSDVPGGYSREDAVYLKYTVENSAGLPNLLHLELRGNGENLRLVYAEIQITP